ncbi:MAG: metal-dependent hydrolase [Bacillota bacterium]
MFIGHFGAGLASKKVERAPSLGTLFMASQFIDLLWPVLLLFGLEKVIIEPGKSAFTPLNFIYYPFSHSLLGVLTWGLLFGLVYFLYSKNMRASVILGFLVLSHWILDLITHIPDLPLAPGIDIKLGFGLWNSVILTIIVEGAIFITGAYLYMSATKSKNKKGNIGLWGLLVLLGGIYVMNIFSAPPPDEQAIGVIGLLQWLFIALGYWVDRNRIVKGEEKSQKDIITVE